MKKKIFVICVLLMSHLSIAAEVDSYSGTDNYIFTARSFINEDINNRLKNAVEKLNADEISCAKNNKDAEEVYEYIQNALIENISTFFVGHFIAEYFNETIPDNKKIVIPFERSVYHDISFLDGISLWLKGTLGIIKVNGYFHFFGANYIGVDKLGHFFVEGFSFFEKAYLENDGDISKAIKWGVETENGKYGLVTTGVFSHADLVANFNGMRFWNQILHFSDDPLEKFFYHNKPFLSCKRAKWELVKDFDLNEYTDAAWDEKINCNDYRNEEIALKVLQGFENAYDSDSWDGFCPAIKTRCEDVREKYKAFPKDLIHQSCLDL